jgi:hypothetical protein
LTAESDGCDQRYITYILFFVKCWSYGAAFEGNKISGLALHWPHGQSCPVHVHDLIGRDARGQNISEFRKICKHRSATYFRYLGFFRRADTHEKFLTLALAESAPPLSWKRPLVMSSPLEEITGKVANFTWRGAVSLALALADPSNHMFFFGEKESVGGRAAFWITLRGCESMLPIFNSMVTFPAGEFADPKKDRNHLKR